MFIDSHVNLHHEAFSTDAEDVIARARAAGVDVMVTICDRIANFAAVAAIADAHATIYATAGAHPHHAKDHLDLAAQHLIDLARAHPKVVGVGETGIDQHYNFSPLDDQIAVFRAHAQAARTLNLPLIIHTREADALMGDLLEEECGRGEMIVLMHCYTSGAELARRALDLGAYFSFSGILTFKNADEVRAVARDVPLDRVILETDCPYLAPVPHRGRRCEPAMVADVYRFFCGQRGLELEEGAAIITENFYRVFRGVERIANGD
jgi:TatD DNase family protein